MKLPKMKLPKMRLLNRKSRLQRVLGAVHDTLDVPSGVKFGLPGAGSGNPLKAGLPQDKARTAGLIAGGVALTAGSAGISSLRRRKEGARDDS